MKMIGRYLRGETDRKSVPREGETPTVVMLVAKLPYSVLPPPIQDKYLKDTVFVCKYALIWRKVKGMDFYIVAGCFLLHSFKFGGKVN